MFTRQQILLLVFIIIFLCDVSLSQDTACGIVWQPALKLSPDTLDAYTPTIATQCDTIHVTWESQYPSLQVPYRRSLDRGQTFGEILEMAPFIDSNSLAGGSKIVVSGKTVYLFYYQRERDNPQPYPPIWMRRSYDRGETWDSARIFFPHIIRMEQVVCLGDTVAMLFQYLDTLALWYRVLVSTDGGEHWRAGEDSLRGFSPQIALSRNWLHGVYHRGFEPYSLEVFYKRSSDLGMSWSDSTVLSTLDGYGGGEPAIVADLGRNVYTAWKETKYGCFGGFGFSCSVVLRKSIDDGTSWSPEQVISDEPYGSQIQLASNNQIFAAVWTKEFINDEYHAVVRLSQDRGNTWCPVFDLTPDTIGGGLPHVAFSTTALQCVWVAYENSHFIVNHRRGELLPVAVDEQFDQMPSKFMLEQNYPNPFNGITRVRYGLPRREYVSLKIYNLLGEDIATLVDGQTEAGWHEAVWEPAGVSSGVYLLRLIMGKYTTTEKVLYVR